MNHTEIIIKIRHMFFLDWDPIGINHYSDDGEYNGYADQVAVFILNSSLDEEKLRKYLFLIAYEYIGMPHSAMLDEKTNAFADKLISFWNEIWNPCVCPETLK
jgi:hypothetical protein